MCGRYYVDDETSREIEKIVRKLDQRLKIEHGQDIHPSESAVILTKECKEVAARQMQWGFPGFQERDCLSMQGQRRYWTRRPFGTVCCIEDV